MERMNRKKLLIGAYYFDQNQWNDAGMNALNDAGIDFLVAISPDADMLDLCQKHNIGVIASNNIACWWGGTGESGGTYCNHMPLEKVDSIAASYKHHPALWGDYPIDEPNNKDFEHMGKVIARYSEKLPDELPFINLHPYYEDVRCTQWLGAPYREYLSQYLEYIPNDYVAFDIYPYSNREVYTPTYLYGLDINSDACRKGGRDLWVIVQTGAWKADDVLAEYQLRLQCMTALAYGARIIMHASWSPGWWDETTSCVNKAGVPNPTVGYVKKIDAELKALSPIYMDYRWKGAVPCGNIDASIPLMTEQLREQGRIDRELYGYDGNTLSKAVESDGALICGCFNKSDGGEAVMLVNLTDIDKDITITVSLPCGKCSDIYINGDKREINCVDGKYSFRMGSGDGAFITGK